MKPKVSGAESESASSRTSACPSHPLHVAVIMDGNGRWATRRGLPRDAGHRAGAEAVRRIVRAAPDLGIGTLSLFAFSCDNWKRPPAEIRSLMRLIRSHLLRDGSWYQRIGARLSVIGRRDRVPRDLRHAMEHAEFRTRAGTTLHVRLAVDYSGRESILRAARRLAAMDDRSGRMFSRLLSGTGRDLRAAPDVDLLIRTGGEKRLSDFLLWECAYAEIVFSDRAWPDFRRRDLQDALREFRRRERRFGGMPRKRTRAAS